MASASSKGAFKSRDEVRADKELEEARKAGTAAPERDEDGNDISPHIPEYIAKAPWYFAGAGPTLKHQRKKEEKQAERRWYKRGVKKGPAATTFRKGSCTNCGAMGHKKKDCFERPRKKEAKFSQKDIVADDIQQPDLELDYEAKHDRWNGFDPAQYQRVIEKRMRVEEERRKLLKEQMKEKALADAEKQEVAGGAGSADSASKGKAAVEEGEAVGEAGEAKKKTLKSLLDDDDDEEADVAADELDDTLLKGDEDQVGTKVDARRRITVRNLRLREDTAKYLLNLDLESAFYDPKTRSMRANPTPKKDMTDVDFVGENFLRQTGQVQEFNSMEQFSVEAADKGQALHMQAAPSQVELMYKQYAEKKEALGKEEKRKILEKYGGEEHLKPMDKALLLGQTEKYVVYAADGRVLQGDEEVVRSKWEEDVYPGNHTAVWGSFWEAGKWGFSCCHQFVRNSYCTGEAGKQARIKVEVETRTGNEEEDAGEEERQERKEKSGKVDKETELRRALEAEERRLAGDVNERKRSYNSMRETDVDVSDAQLEAYRLKRRRTDDPMADFLSK